MYIYSSKSALQIYQAVCMENPCNFWTPLFGPRTYFFTYSDGKKNKSCLLAFLIEKIQVGDPRCNIYMIRFPPRFSHLPCIFSMGKVGFAYLGIAPALQSGKWRRQCLRLRFHGTAPEKTMGPGSMEADCSHSMEMGWKWDGKMAGFHEKGAENSII